MTNYYISIDSGGKVLCHYGIKGMKWGERRFQNPDGTLTEAGKKRYSKMARKDAKEYATAKMYTKEGAGNRRKLIKAKVEQRSKDNPYYKEEFDRYLSDTDWEKAANRAQAQRRTKDAFNVSKRLAKTAFGGMNEEEMKRMQQEIKEHNVKEQYRKIQPKSDLERTRDLLDSAYQTSNQVKNSVKVTKKKQKRMDLSNMSDKELRDKINRELLERQYNDVFNPAQEKKGRKFAKAALEVTSTTLGIAASTASLALAITKLKGK